MGFGANSVPGSNDSTPGADYWGQQMNWPCESILDLIAEEVAELNQANASMGIDPTGSDIQSLFPLPPYFFEADATPMDPQVEAYLGGLIGRVMAGETSPPGIDQPAEPSTFSLMLMGLPWILGPEALAVEGTGATTWQEYQSAVNNMYGGQASYAARQFSTAAGNWVADNVVNIGGNQVAIESKFIGSGGWEGSIYNPASPVGNMPFAVAEQADTLAQAQAYSSAFDQVIYHSNSSELIQYYSSVFNDAGIENIQFILTK
jgi:hypothetical protein